MPITLPTRDALIAAYERDYRIRRPGAAVGEKTLPGIEARLVADMLLPLYAEAKRLGEAVDLSNLVGTELEQEAEDLGLPRRLPAVGASGNVAVTTATGGVTIFFTEDGVLDWIQKHNTENIAGSMKASTPWIEDTREFFGLVILIIVLAVNYIYAKRKGRMG